ncbi:MAG: Calx-beta domain-containing protein [Planctomycetaceae bacterium]
MAIFHVDRGRRTAATAVSLEMLERRDCPAVIGLAGTREVSEAAGTASITVSLSAADTKPVSIDYRLEGTATNGSDFRLANGTSNAGFPTGTITFAPGQVSQTLTVRILNDTIREPAETVKVSLFKPRNATLGTASSATVTIVDDDSYTAHISGASRIDEGATDTYELVLSSPATKTETFYVNTVPGLATQGIDYRPLTQMPLVFNAGEIRKSFRVQSLADSAPEADEFFFVQATPADATFPKVSQKGVTIAGLGPASLPQLTIGDATVIEGDAGTTSVAVPVSLSFASPNPVSFGYRTADGSAWQGLDYQAASGVVTIPVGETSTVITVNALGDLLQEDDETFMVTASAAQNAALSKATGTVTIVDDDTAFRIDIKFVSSALGSVPASVQALARQAARRWTRIITGDLPNVPVAGGAVIDDFELTVQMGLLGGSPNGPSGTIANARPTAFRPGLYGLPYQGETGLDPNDVLNISSPAQQQWVVDVITHELGHALGFASSNPGFQRWIQGSTWIGANAVREYSTISGSGVTSVPLETGGGAGTAGAHWAEDVFGAELMTGFASDVGTPMPLSKVTAGAFQDLGYTVSYAAADPYTLPAIRSNGMVSRSSQTATSGRPMAALMSQAAYNLVAFIGQADLERTAATSPKQKAFAVSSRA